MTQRTVPGPFAAVNLGEGRWNLTSALPSGPDIYLQGVGADAAEFSSTTGITALGFEWHADGVSLTLTAGATVRRVHAKSAIIHESKPALYRLLPLAGFDSDAQRFWRRVFLLIRMPGGRVLLRIVARRRRSKR